MLKSNLLLKGALLGVKQFLATENPSKMMKNGFFSPKNLFSLLIYLTLWPDCFGPVGKQLDKKAKVNFKIHGVINWEANNYNTHTAQYLKK